MRFAAIFAIMLAGLLVLGCTSAPAQPQEPAAAVPAEPEFVPQEEVPVEAPVVPAETAPVVNETPTEELTGCAALTGTAQSDCVFAQARDARDVTVCASPLLDKDGRFRCITQWCGSEARDFNQCEKLSEDDRLGCLNKCNPNMNT